MRIGQSRGIDEGAGPGPLPRPPSWKVWWLAIRPKTLTIAVAPVFAGSSLALAETGALQWLLLILALLGAVLIQTGTNLQNDAGDFIRGTDSPKRLGPKRVTAAGWLNAAQVHRAALLAFCLAAAAGLYLVWVGGWPILILGLLSIAAGLAYTSGPLPIAYTAMGELFVFLFFGLGAVMGSYYLQTLRVTWPAAFLACAIGLLCAAVLVVNNYRDMESDWEAGRITLAHRLGRDGTKLLYVLMLTSPYLLLPMFREYGGGVWLPLLLLPWTTALCWRFCTQPPGPVFNRLLVRTTQLLFLFALLLGLGVSVAQF